MAKKRKTYTAAAERFAKTPEGRERQLANLQKGRDRCKGPKPPKDGIKDLRNMNIIEFATQRLNIDFFLRPAQEVLLRCLYGLPLDEKQIEIYRILTGNTQIFEHGVEKVEALWSLGARSGKSFLASIIALNEGIVKASHWKKHVSKGESPYIVIIATRMQQAQAIIGANCQRLLENSSLDWMVGKAHKTELELRNGIKIISLPCTSTAGRGLPVACLIMDEIAHFYTEGPKADEAIYNSLRPRLAQFPGAKTVLISTPAGKQGLFWNTFAEGYEVPGRLTAQAPTTFMNPLVSEKFLEREKLRDIDNYSREFDAQFAENVDSFFPADKLNAAFVLSGDLGRSPKYQHFAGVDQSGLSGNDKFGFSVAHRDDKGFVLVDCVRSWATTDGDMIMREIELLCHQYNIGIVAIDKYGSGWVRQAFENLGLQVEIRPELPKVFVNTKSLLLSGKLRLPDSRELRDAMTQTQAFYSRSNSLSISHPRTKDGHGDVADAVCSAVYLCSGGRFTEWELIEIGQYG